MINNNTANMLPPVINETGGGYLGGVLGWIFYLIGAVAVVMIIYAGIQYITSAGDAGKMANAKNTIIWSVIGLVLAILASVIVQFVNNTLS